MLYLSDYAQKTDQENGKPKLTNKAESILKLIKKNPSRTRKELALKIKNITSDDVKYHLKRMQEEKVIKRVYLSY